MTGFAQFGDAVITAEFEFKGKTYSDSCLVHVGVPAEGVDLSNAIILKYKNGSSASLLASFELPSLNNAVVVGDRGSIVTDKWFFCCNEATLYDADGIVVEKCSLPVKVNGYEYEIMEANRCLREGLLESPMIPHADTIAIMQIMDECRKQWNMKYPEEIEK